MIYTLFIIMFTSIIFQSCSQPMEPGKDYAFADIIQPIPITNIQKDSAWNIWCGSMVKGYDNKYHLYYSRWPRSCGHEAWISHSEIAYAVSDTPDGPYQFVNVSIPAYAEKGWDNATSHNPYIIQYNNKYYLYYAGTTGNLVNSDHKIAAYGAEWWERRNTQRIGVAVADNPQGPWKRFNTPVLSVSSDSTAFDALCVTNPAICIGRNNKIVMVYKAVSKNGTQSGGVVRFSVAFADSPTGPFIKTNQLIFQPEKESEQMVAEDPFIWFDKKRDKYYAIVRDVVGQFTGEDSGGLALLQSKDAIHWTKTERPKVLPVTLQWENGTLYHAKEDHVERPFLYFNEKGIPELLFGAFSIHRNGIHREHSFNGRIPLRFNSHKQD